MVKAYYEGGCRVLIGGVPTRLASKPTPNRLKILRDTTASRNMRDTADKRKRDTEQLRAYAAALGITVAQVYGRIAAQENHLARTPTVDMSDWG